MSDGLTVSFRGLLPDEGMTTFSQRLYRTLPDGLARGAACHVRVSREPESGAIRVSVELACRTRRVNATGTARNHDACRALTRAFAATSESFEAALSANAHGTLHLPPRTRKAVA